MYGHRPRPRPRFRPGSGERGSAPPSHPPAPPQDPNLLLQTLNFQYLQNPAAFSQPFNPYLQNTSFPPHIPNFPFQNPNLQLPNPAFPPPNPPSKPREALERVNAAATKAHRDLLAAGDTVSAWKVSQSALVALQADSWESLGYRMQEVPSIHSLMITEGKISAFIHCYVGVRRVTSLYDLDVSICKNESVERFEELELGPLVRHPLILHYFSLGSDAAGVFKITTEEIISYLAEYMDGRKSKAVKVEQLLDFIAYKRGVASKEILGVRIQSLGLHITFIQEAKKLDDIILTKCFNSLKEKSMKGKRKRPLLSSQKKELDLRYSVISQRVKSFSTAHQDFIGKHIRFTSSSSEETDSDEDDCEEEDDVEDVGSHCKPIMQNISSDKVSSCPYPSATEEKMRLGLNVETDNSPGCGSLRLTDSGCPLKKKKSENSNSTSGAPKYSRRAKVKKDVISVSREADGNNLEEPDLSIASDALRFFITTWKEACREHNVVQVLDRMLQFYDVKAQRKMRLKLLFSSYPFLGLLNVAVTSIKRGMWDSIYDAFQDIDQVGLDPMVPENCSQYESIDVEPSGKGSPLITKDSSELKCSVPAEDIISKISTYFGGNDNILLYEKSVSMKCMFLRKLCDCEGWLAEQFSVKEFSCLGFGDLFMFLENFYSMLPGELYKCFIGEICHDFSLEASMLQDQLVFFLAQASSSLREGDILSRQKISWLLVRQFPLVCFKLNDYGSMENFLDIIKENKCTSSSKPVLFSSTLLGPSNYREFSAPNEVNLLRTSDVKSDVTQRLGVLGPVTSKDAIDTLLRAPMLSNLIEWSHWDLIFAPSLGPLLQWLLNEVNNEELMCMVTNDGKIVRIDRSATVDSFLEASIQGSSFQTAVTLFSLIPLYGGVRHVPLALLKSHAIKAFEVLYQAYGHDSVVNGRKKLMMHETVSCRKQPPDEAVPYLSLFIIEVVCHLPSEARAIAADVLLAGLQSVIKDAPSAILFACKQREQRHVIHQVGLSLGVTEWINDYHTFCDSSVTDLSKCSRELGLKVASTRSKDVLPLSDYPKRKLDSVGLDGLAEEHKKVRRGVNGTEACDDKSGDLFHQNILELNEDKDAARVIESIRLEEFGLDPTLPNSESDMLKKQHARLGRALHCLSQELYSQDSHFLLELVQNADDNTYPDNVQPTLSFILLDEAIIVLNNERGFSERNIRALCDVGSSTKKGSGAGYIGQKGIGFKSVFRVTDAPEIHSNGYHVKFDISEGQIGFVLPTSVPPCDLNLFRSLVSCDTDHVGEHYIWNTSIVLPFRSKLLEGSAMSSIISMFSDLHPSLLLFLHRLQCIQFRNMLNNSLIVMRKEIVGEGIIKVSYGEEEMIWYVAYKELQAGFIRPDVKTTEIAIAFTLKDTDNGDYSPHLDQQPAFAFLPLRTYGLKFIVQGDFVLPSSREEVDGDSPWNQWLLSEFPALFVDAEKSFCAISCFKRNLGKAVATYMSYVPLVGEVHGFFSSLPRLIILKLKESKCLLLEGNCEKWVPPCKVLRNWDMQARILLPDDLLNEHLGLGFLDKDIILSDQLAGALGIEDYGPKTLLQVMRSLCQRENHLKSMGLSWLRSWFNALYTMLLHPIGKITGTLDIEMDLIDSLRKLPFIPLSGGTYGALDQDTIWLHSDAVGTGSDGEHGLDAFPNLWAKLRIVDPLLFAAATSEGSGLENNVLGNLSRMLYKIGIQQLSAHEIVKVQVLPALSNDSLSDSDKDLMTEYLSFVMFHLQSTCANCRVERGYIISELCSKAFIMTNHGWKRTIEVPIHFSKEYGNPVDVNKLISSEDLKWHEVGLGYLKHPITGLLLSGTTKWREFFKELGVSDFVHASQVERSSYDISSAFHETMMQNGVFIFPDSVLQDWESCEMADILSSLSLKCNTIRSKYLLEVLDVLWDEWFGDKIIGRCISKSNGDTKAFRSSFIRSICEIKWVASSMDEELHYPKELFHDCDAVSSILGVSAPYAVPKVKNERLLTAIGFRSQVTIDDALEILQLWRRSGTPFKASLTQMSKFYTFIWNEMGCSRQKILAEFQSGPSIFVPFSSGSLHQDIVPGIFLSPGEVYWHDSTGSMDRNKRSHPPYISSSGDSSPLSKTLHHLYPHLHDFFVTECGVQENPSFRSYLQYLLQLSAICLPSDASNVVFRVFLHLVGGPRSRLECSEDIAYLKECLLKSDFTVLPTAQDKWVSLHPSFGLVCWCDDKALKKEFKHFNNIDFLYFGELNSKDEEFQADESIVMRTLGIPSISEVVTREAVYHGLTDSKEKALLVHSALAYAQRYIYHRHPDTYSRLKISGFEVLNQLEVVAVEKLLYQNVIKRCNITSKKRSECSCLLQDKILYIRSLSDSHSIFMELSRLFFDGNPELHVANFLHMIKTMAESGSTEEQQEFFILNSQKVPELPDEEPVWSLASCSGLAQLEKVETASGFMSGSHGQLLPSFRRKPEICTNYPPLDWTSAPGFSYALLNNFCTWPSVPQPLSCEADPNGIVTGNDLVSCTREDGSEANLLELNVRGTEPVENQHGDVCAVNNSGIDIVTEPSLAVSATNGSGWSSIEVGERDQLMFRTPNARQALTTGREGERAAFEYFSKMFGEKSVRWINKDNETGLPYDIVVEDNGNISQYIEVKATRSASKDWFFISLRELLFAVQNRQSVSIAYVVLSANNDAKVRVFKNPADLWLQKILHLAVIVPKQQEVIPAAS